ncbi:MAG: ankyrin repeat domain-containing protein [Cyanobacteria bacterium]|nr:ankyrin repeat domain-containing protein [Cyanobacteriota bacterium]
MIQAKPPFSAQSLVKASNAPSLNFGGRPIGRPFPEPGADQFVKQSVGDGSAPDFVIDSGFTLDGKVFNYLKELIQLEHKLLNGLKPHEDVALEYFQKFLAEGGLNALSGVKVLVDELSANVNAQDPKTGNTPLILAQQPARRGNNLKTTVYLLARGADPRLADANGNTPLHHAVLNQQLESARLFLETDPTLATLKNKDGKTPLDLASKEPGPQGQVSMYTFLNTPQINF